VKRPKRALALAALASSLLVAASDARLASGLWEMRNTPGVATLDGRVLSELPIGPIKTQTICLAPSEAAVRFLTRDLGADCSVGRATTTGGRIDVQGTCPNQVEGPDGSFRLAGTVRSRSYAVEFATTAVGENGRMTFSGKLSGRRIGNCPAA
jgi:hypothetical protein